MIDLKLKPCPFCGNSHFDLEDTLYPSGETWRWSETYQRRIYAHLVPFDNQCWQISCPCGVEVHEDSKEDVVEKWNGRV